jgi:NAD-specific glutamate dehydrogenase
LFPSPTYASTPSYLREHEAEVERLSGLGVPLEAARRTAAMDVLHSALDIVEVAEETGNSTTVVGKSIRRSTSG